MLSTDPACTLIAALVGTGQVVADALPWVQALVPLHVAHMYEHILVLALFCAVGPDETKRAFGVKHHDHAALLAAGNLFLGLLWHHHLSSEEYS
jgi:hypothetical protein